MNTKTSFIHSTCADQIRMAERELASFVCAVTELFGPEQAQLAGNDWLEESDLMDITPRSAARDWRAVTVAAAGRLANRLVLGRGPKTASPTDTKVSPMPSSNCFEAGLRV